MDSLDTKKLVPELINLCKKYESNREEIVFHIKDYPYLNRALETLRIFRYPGEGMLWWCAHLRSGEVPDPSQALLEVVKVKMIEALKYQWKDATEKWLIIIAEAKLVEDTVISFYDPEISKYCNDVNFTKIFLWDRCMDEVVELFPEHKKLCDSLKQVRNIGYYPETIKPFFNGLSKYPPRTKGGYRLSTDK